MNSASSAAALVFYLPCVCTLTDTEGEQRKARVRKNTIFNEHPVRKRSIAIELVSYRDLESQNTWAGKLEIPPPDIRRREEGSHPGFDQ